MLRRLHELKPNLAFKQTQHREVVAVLTKRHAHGRFNDQTFCKDLKTTDVNLTTTGPLGTPSFRGTAARKPTRTTNHRRSLTLALRANPTAGTSRCVQSRRTELVSEFVVQEIEDEDAGVQGDRLPILSLEARMAESVTDQVPTAHVEGRTVELLQIQAQLQSGGTSNFSTERGTRTRNRQNTVETPQVQLMNKVVIWTCQSLRSDRRRWSRQCSEVQQLQFFDKVIKIPVLAQRQIPVEVDTPVGQVEQVPQAQVVQKTVAIPQTSSLTETNADHPEDPEEC